MGGYIRVDKEQVTDQRLFDIADRLSKEWCLTRVDGSGQPLSDNDNCHAMRNALLGVTVTLWSYADTHINADNSLRVTLSGLAAIVGVPVTMLQALPREWLRVRPDGYIELPGYCEKNHINARDLRREERNEDLEHRREADRERQRKHREKKKAERHAVTSHEKSRDSHAVTPPTGTGTGSLRPNPVPRAESDKTPTPHGALASAQGHLARRLNADQTGTNGHGDGVTGVTRKASHTSAELEAFAHRMAAAGDDSDAIAKILEPLGATRQQVTQWLANTPPAEPTPGEASA